MKNHIIGILLLIFFSTSINSYGVEDGYKIEVLDSVSDLTLFIDLDCYDINNCALIRMGPGNNGLIVTKSSDGGKNWEIIYTDTTRKLNSNEMYFPDDNPTAIRYYSNGLIRVFTRKGRIIYSENNGITWNKTDNIDNFSFTSLVTLDINRAILSSQFAFGGAGSREIFKTNNGGKTWSKFLPDSISDKWEFSFVQKQYDNNILLNCISKDSTKWDFSKLGFVLTDFEGSYWNFMEFPNYIFWPYFINKDEAIAIGNFRRENLYMDTAVILKTYDAGKTWDLKFKSVEQQQIYSFSDYLYYDDNLMYVFGENFNILKSTDKGESWYFPIKQENKVLPSNYTGSPVMPERNVLYFLTTHYSRVIRYSPIEMSIRNEDILSTSIYPNPVTDFITIQFSNKELQPFAAEEKVQIFDILGLEVMTVGIGLDLSSQRIDVSHLPAGVYFIRIGNKVEKFVKL